MKDITLRNRKAENVIWAVSTIMIIIYMIVFVLVSESEYILAGIVFGVATLIMLCASVFSEGRNKQGCLIVYAILVMGVSFICHQLWCGLPVLTATALYSCYDFLLDSGKKNILVNVFFVAGFAYWSRRLTSEKMGPGRYIAVAGLIIFAVLWSLAIYWLFKYFEMNSNLEKALKSSALDAMNERQLRMEIAESKNMAEENARLEERERISRDIHNAVGHTLSAATVTLDAAQMLIDTDTSKANQKIDQANERIHEAIGSVRSVVRTLDAEDDCVLVEDYVNSLKELINNFTLDTEIKVHHNLDLVAAEEKRRQQVTAERSAAPGNDEGGAQVQNESGKGNAGKIHITRAAFISNSLSELLTNGVKHGGATVFVVLMTLDSTHIGIQVSDNGTGWGEISYEEKQAKLRNGFGLRKMSDYVKSNGGTFDVDGSEGFCVKMDMMR